MISVSAGKEIYEFHWKSMEFIDLSNLFLYGSVYFGVSKIMISKKLNMAYIYIYTICNLKSDVQKTLFYNAISMVLRSRRRVAGVENMENHWNMHNFSEKKCVKIDFWPLFRFVQFRGDILTPKTVS